MYKNKQELSMHKTSTVTHVSYNDEIATACTCIYMYMYGISNCYIKKMIFESLNISYPTFIWC